MLRDGSSWTAIQDAFGCSRATIAKVAKRAAPASHGALTNCSTLPSILRVSLFAQDRRRSEPVACNDRRLIRACGPSREGKLYFHTLSGRGQLEITRIGHGPRAA